MEGFGKDEANCKELEGEEIEALREEGREGGRMGECEVEQ